MLTPSVQEIVQLLEVSCSEKKTTFLKIIKCNASLSPPQVAIFQASSTFASTLQWHQKATIPSDTVIVQKNLQHDAFLPGYSGVKKVLESVGVNASTSEPAHPEQEVKIEEKVKEDRNSKENVVLVGFWGFD